MRIKLMGRVREIPDLYVLLLLDLLLFLTALYTVNKVYAGTPYYPIFLGFSLLLALLIPFGYFYWEYIKVLERERYFPQFLKDLADIYRTGMSLIQAVYHTSKQNYGALTPQVKRLAVRLSWGVPFEEALRLFAKETKSPLIGNAVLIILEAFNSGGDVANVLETVAEDMRRMRDLREDRKSRFSAFVGTMYVVFLISIGLSHVLLNVLLPEIPVMPSFSLSFSVTGGATTGSATTLPLYEMKVLFLHLLLIQALISGLLAGIAGEGSLVAGLKHVIIMSLLALVLYQLFIMPTDPAERLGRTIARTPAMFSVSVDLGKMYVEKNITAADVRRHMTGFFGRKDVPFSFVQDPSCKPCGESVVVRPDGVYIKEPVYLRFRVMSNGDGTVTVFVG